MKRKRAITLLLSLLILSSVFSQAFAQETGTAVVQAILFYQPTCPHCHEVIETHLPPIKDKYGDQFQLIGVDTSLQAGAELYQETVVALNLPSDRLGVPLLVVGDVALVGSQEIPRELPAIIEKGLASGGIGWPVLSALHKFFPDLPPSAVNTDEANSAGADIPVVDGSPPLSTASFSATPTLNLPDSIIGWAVISFSLVAIIYSAILMSRAARKGHLKTRSTDHLTGWHIPVLGLAGLAIAVYLAYVELTQNKAVCGPVGECNVVQSSQYAHLVGIPVAVYGVLFFLSVLGLWLLLRYQKGEKMGWIAAALTALSLFGTLFSIYLTALELLVISAVCAWCLTSALISALLLLFTVSQWLKEGSSHTHEPEIASQSG